MSETVSLREYVDVRFDAQEKAVSAALAAQEKAVSAALAAADRAVAKAEAASEKRFEGVNEFRAALGDNARLMMPRAEAETVSKMQSEKIDVLDKRLTAKDDRVQGRGELWGYVVGAVGVVVAVVAVVNALLK